jgi:hypothetical protein
MYIKMIDKAMRSDKTKSQPPSSEENKIKDIKAICGRCLQSQLVGRQKSEIKVQG